MTYISELIQTVGPFFLLLGLLIFIHELGHFSVARFFGIRVEIFSIGFGKTLFKIKRGDTEYRLSAFPLGGYVKMFGDNPTAEIPKDEQKYSFIHQPVFPRIAVVIAGPLMNLVLALFVFFCIGLYGEPQISPTLGDIEENTAAYRAGLRSGDKILSIDDHKVLSFDETLKLISESKNNTVKVIGERDGQTFEFQVPTEIKTNPNILSSERSIPQVDGWSFYSRASTVAFTDPNSDLFLAGLKNLDTINKINQTEITTQRDLKKFFDTLSKEDVKELKIQVSRLENDNEVVLNFISKTENLNFESTETYIGRAQKGSPAEKSGLKRGDKVISVGGISIQNWDDLIAAVKLKSQDKSPITFKILRDFKELEISVEPQIKSMMNERGQEIQRPIVGVEPGFYIDVPDQVYVPAGGLSASLIYSGQQTWKWTVWTLNSMLRVIQGEVSHKNLGGFITIGQVAKESFKVGWSYFFQMMGIISINLFLLNLFPIPVLDGGHLVFYVIEAIRGQPVSPKKMEIAFMFGFALLMSLVGLTLFNDIQRVFFSGW